MSIEIRCQGCGKLYGVSETLIGKKVRCKGCGAVMLVAASAGKTANKPKSAAQPMRAKASAPPPPLDDPFENPNAFMASEDGGVAEEAAPYMPPVSRAPVADWDYVSIPGEKAIDRFVPWIPIGVFAVFLVMVLVRGISTVNEFATQFGLNDNEKARGIGRVCGITFGIAVAVAGISASLCLIGVYVASRIMKFKNRPVLYWKCLAVACTPWTAAFVCSGCDLRNIGGVASVLISLLAMVAALWLLIRLRPKQFAMTAGLVLVLGAGLPAVIVCICAPSQFGAMHEATMFAAGVPQATSSGRANSARSAGSTMFANPDDILAPHLKKIWETLAEYAVTHDGHYPAGLRAIGRGELLSVQTKSTLYMLDDRNWSKYKAPLPRTLIVAEVLGMRAISNHGLPFVLLFGDGHIEAVASGDCAKVRRESAEAETEAMRWLATDSSTPMGTAVSFFIALAKGDAETVKTRGYNVDSALLEARAKMSAAVREMLHETSRRFPGVNGAEPRPPKSDDDLFHEMMENIVQNSMEKVIGDVALISNGHRSFDLKRIDGRWRIDAGPVFNKPTSAETQLGIMMLNIYTRAANKLTQEISTGQVSDWITVKRSYVETIRIMQLTDVDFQNARAANSSVALPSFGMVTPWSMQRDPPAPATVAAPGK